MVECGWTEKKITLQITPPFGIFPPKPVSYANVRYGKMIGVAEETIKTDLTGKAEFCYLRGFTPYVSIQKTDYVFSDRPITLLPTGQPSTEQSWGASSEWIKVPGLYKTIFSFKKPVELPPVEEVIDEVEEVIEKIIEEVCRTEADPTVPAALSAYFPISIRNAKWICDGIPENITGTGIIRIKGSEVARIPIRNGYGSPINLGTTPVFRDLLKELVG